MIGRRLRLTESLRPLFYTCGQCASRYAEPRYLAYQRGDGARLGPLTLMQESLPHLRASGRSRFLPI